MARPFDFGRPTRDQARFRQFGLCAVCGEDLVDLEEQAHHVVPNQSGNPANPEHGWLRLVDNCVILCEACHSAVHQHGHFRNGAVAPPSYYEHSHGRNRRLHQGWAAELNARTQLHFGHNR
jgi:5-methylcytosine-specific restriction endonuclease McrA